jgi:hypothetical protein
MTDSLSITRSLGAWVLVLTLALPALGQITQDHPELCGKPNGYVPLPPNITAVSSDTDFIFSIRLGSSTADVHMPAVEQIREVCPIGKNRLLVFGAFHDPNAHVVYLIDAATGAELDSFTVSNPAVSPDQHWLAAREWEPFYVDPPSSVHYYLYDLTKDAAGNKFPGVDYGYVPHLGRMMYPVTPKHLPAENPPSGPHSFEGESFQWAPDSKSVAFLDRTPSRLALVLVRIGADDLTTYLHPLPADACTSTISRTNFGPAEGKAAHDVRVEFGDACPPLHLRGHDFKLAPIVVPKPIHRTPSVPDKR